MPEELTPALVRRELAEIIAAAFICSIGFAAAGLYAFRRRSTDIASLAFAAFATLYAVRLLVSTDLVRSVVPGSPEFWEYAIAGLTYGIVIVSAWSAETLLGRGWRDSLVWLRRMALIFSPIAVAGMFVTREPEWAMPANNVLILLLLTLVATTSLRSAGDRNAGVSSVRAGVAIAVVFVLLENLRSIGLLPWPARLEFLGIVAFLAALAFAVADRFLRTESRLVGVDRELATARRIQQAILPASVPTLARFRIDARYVPMTEVAGDFYDFLDVGNGRGTILVADVSGHGVPAALIASMVKIAAASHHEASSDPGRLLTAMSQTLHGQLGGQFVTAMCLHIDGPGGRAAYAGAGHPPILHWRAADRRLEPLASAGILMGVVPATYESGFVPLAAGDRLVVYTDGVLEAANAAGEFFGDARFHAVVSTGGPRPADAILAEMTRWVAPRQGFDDDVTLVVVEVE